MGTRKSRNAPFFANMPLKSVNLGVFLEHIARAFSAVRCSSLGTRFSLRKMPLDSRSACNAYRVRAFSVIHDIFHDALSPYFRCEHANGQSVVACSEPSYWFNVCNFSPRGFGQISPPVSV